MTVKNSSKTILLVEDEFLIAACEANLLEKNGYRVIIASSGEAAIEKVVSGEDINLVLMDIDLGSGIDGTVAADAIIRQSSVPVVFLSSHSEPEVIAKTEKITAYGYILKNSSDDFLLASVKMALRLNDAHERICRQNDEIESANEELTAAFEEMEAANEELIASQGELLSKDNELAESHALYRDLVETMQDLIWQCDSEGRYTFLNSAWESFLGYSIAEMTGRRFTDFAPPSDIDKLMTDFYGFLSGDGFKGYEMTHVARDGSVKNIAVSARPVKSQDGAVTGLRGSAHDITERKISEKKLYESERRYRLLFENMTSGFALHEIVLDDAGKPCDFIYLEINPAFEKHTGVKASSLLGRRLSEVLPETEQYWIDVFARVALSGEPAEYQNYMHDLGKYFDTVAFSPERGQFAVIFNDVTERKKSEDAREKLLEDKDVLFRELQHRVKNNLNMISSMLSLESRSSTDEKISHVLDSIRGRVNVMGNLYTVLYQSGGVKSIDSASYVRQIIESCKGNFIGGCPAAIDFDSDSFDLDVRLAPAVGLILNELFMNAVIHAFTGRKSGSIDVSFKLSGKRAQLCVTDDGGALSPDFDVESATTMGLRLVSLMVKQLDGSMSVMRGGVTQFCVSFDV